MTQDISIQALTFDAVSMDENVPNEQGILTREEEQKIAALINRAINIPFMSEKREGRIFLAGVRLVDTALAKCLPKDLLECIHEIKDGVTQEEVAALEKRMTPIINGMVNIPVIPEFIEARLIRLVSGIILNSIRKGASVLS